MNVRACIAHPCIKKRVKNSAFCKTHKDIHAKSKYPALLKQLCDDVISRRKK